MGTKVIFSLFLLSLWSWMERSTSSSSSALSCHVHNRIPIKIPPYSNHGGKLSIIIIIIEFLHRQIPTKQCWFCLWGGLLPKMECAHVDTVDNFSQWGPQIVDGNFLRTLSLFFSIQRLKSNVYLKEPVPTRHHKCQVWGFIPFQSLSSKVRNYGSKSGKIWLE